jgi:hypothetical protein
MPSSRKVMAEVRAAAADREAALAEARAVQQYRDRKDRINWAGAIRRAANRRPRKET